MRQIEQEKTNARRDFVAIPGYKLAGGTTPENDAFQQPGTGRMRNRISAKIVEYNFRSIVLGQHQFFTGRTEVCPGRQGIMSLCDGWSRSDDMNIHFNSEQFCDVVNT